MSSLYVAAVLAAVVLVASMLSVELGLSVAIIEIVAGTVVGNTLHLSNPEWLAFLASFGSVVLTFLAGAEVDPEHMRATLKPSVLIGVFSFRGPRMTTVRGIRQPAENFYRPAEVAKILRCSEWWIKEQARRGRIPFSWIGGRYLFTQKHIAEIVSLFESRPAAATAYSTTNDAQSVSRPRRTQAGRPAARLKARTPRRARTAPNAA